LNLPCDVLATSEDWGFTKPDAAFFSKLIAVSGHASHEVAYVGDRLDNDLLPAFMDCVGGVGGIGTDGSGSQHPSRCRSCGRGSLSPVH